MSGVLVYFYIVFTVTGFIVFVRAFRTTVHMVMLLQVLRIVENDLRPREVLYGNVCTYIVLLPVTNSTEYRVRMASVCLLRNRRGRE